MSAEHYRISESAQDLKTVARLFFGY